MFKTLKKISLSLKFQLSAAILLLLAVTFIFTARSVFTALNNNYLELSRYLRLKEQSNLALTYLMHQERTRRSWSNIIF